MIKTNKKSERSARKAERLAKLMEMSNEIEAAIMKHNIDHRKFNDDILQEEGWEEAWANRVK